MKKLTLSFKINFLLQSLTRFGLELFLAYSPRLVLPWSKSKTYQTNLKKLVHWLSLVVVLVLFCHQSWASQLPRFLGSEKKFRAFVYNPNDVYRYLGHYTYQGFIEFEADEQIATITMGDSSAWLFEHLGNRLFLKPVSDNANTNMTVITNKRVYHFDLIAKEAKGIDDKDLIFVAKFVYPDEKDKNILEFPKIPPSDEPDMRNLSVYNFNYEFTGEPSVAPSKVFDNGQFTYFQFTNKNAEVPAIFSVDSAGFESLVNFRPAGDYIVVERVASQFTLRNGSEIVCIYNNNMLRSGKIISPPAAPVLKSPPLTLNPSGVEGSSPMPRSPARLIGPGQSPGIIE